MHNNVSSNNDRDNLIYGNKSNNIELLNLTNDYVFKRIFGYKGNEDITRAFIQAITLVRYENISLGYTSVLEKELENNKVGILDIRAVVDEYTNIDIEMQVAK